MLHDSEFLLVHEIVYLDAECTNAIDGGFDQLCSVFVDAESLISNDEEPVQWGLVTGVEVAAGFRVLGVDDTRVGVAVRAAKVVVGQLDLREVHREEALFV